MLTSLRWHLAGGLVFILCAAMAFAAQPEPTAQRALRRSNQVQRLKARSDSDKNRAWQIARRHGWTPRGKSQGIDRDSTYELMAIKDGRIYVVTTCNVSAAISTAANQIRNIAPYNLNGAGLTLGLWDEGSARPTHQEFGGRSTAMDGASASNHSTHVGGTIGAAGVVASALGMAPAVSIDSYDWNSDTSEMNERAMSTAGESGTIQVSSHSYGYLSGWSYNTSPPRWYGTWGQRESENFGIYDYSCNEWDEVCYENPYYLPFVAAGNDRDNEAPSDGTIFQYFDDSDWVDEFYDSSTGPYDDGWKNGGFDTISFFGSAKNIVTVGAVNDAVSGSTRSLAKATIAEFSCWGPTDDGRIKPDVVGNGVLLYSCGSSSDTAYVTMSGTSMATPNVSGSAMLLLDYYSQLFPGQYMRASTLKGLIIHTADDLGNAGPDYSTGWGLMNVKAAADHLKSHSDLPNGHRIVESQLSTTTSARQFTFFWDATQSIRVTLCWTDPPGNIMSGLNNSTITLKNDLDLRVIAPDGSTTYLPYVLDPANPSNTATTGDNIRDNVEQVYIASPSQQGFYTVQVSHKDTLVNNQQNYSLLLSGEGISSEGTLNMDRELYNCADTIALRLTDSDLASNSTQTIQMLAGTDTETVTLTANPAGSGIFAGSILTTGGSAVAGNGTLQLADGLTITARYDDLDHGGSAAVVEDTATADCQVPTISNVTLTGISGSLATVTFQTDESTQGTVQYGLACNTLNQEASETISANSHTLTMTALQPQTTYYFTISATDQAGNTVIDDAGGSCYSFTTLEQADYFTELFSSSDNDLDYQMVTFTPNDSASGYTACRRTISALPSDPTGGTSVTLADDAAIQVTLADNKQVVLYGIAYSQLYIGSNGFLTFTESDLAYSESLNAHFRIPRVAALFDDLNPPGGGTISYKQWPNRFTVTYENVYEYGSTTSSTFQIEMFFDGRIRLNYQNVAASDGLVGLSAGGGQPTDFEESSFSAYSNCLLSPDLDGDGDVDMADFGAMQACLTGSAVSVTSDCALIDLDGNNHVDNTDLYRMMSCMSGEQIPATTNCTAP